MDSTDPVSTVTSVAKDSSPAGQPPDEAAAQPDGRAWSAEGRLARSGRAEWQRRMRRAVRMGLVRASQPTRRARMLPSFLIVGAQRCGTTSLFHVLAQHPAVFSPVLNRKELHYFDNEYSRGLGWYQSQFPIGAWARVTARNAGVTPVAFEGSPYYMFHPLAPARIHRDLPGVRLLVLVRDPVERAYSQHAHQVGLGLETESFERALELEEDRIAGETERLINEPSYNSRKHWLYAYRARGHYADQLQRMESLFGRDRIHVVDSGDFFTDPGPAYDRVLGFLNLPAHSPAFTPQNARPRSPMPETLRASLDEHFRPHDERLAAWLGHEPSWRR